MTSNILGPWQELPPQLASLTAETRLVTVTIGGNDLGFVSNLFAANCREQQDETANATQKCLATKLPTEDDYTRVEAQMRVIAAQVATRAPHTKLVFVDYLSLVPPQSCEATRLSSVDIATLGQLADRLAGITARVAAESGAMLLPAGKLSRDHDPCSTEPWSNGARPGKLGGIPWHPNAAGMQAIADALAERLRP
jgi:lysophospholipase L1-like esterase